MAWLTKAQATQQQPRPAESIWTKCESCQAHSLKEEWQRRHRVCPKCGHHDKLTASERINLLLDPGTFEEFNEDIAPGDPLNFVDGKGPYKDKVVAARKQTQLNEAVVTGTGKIHDLPVVLAVMDFRFLGGSLGSGTGEKILQGAMVAYERRIPYIVVSGSGGARMQEGMLSLVQMAKTCAGVARLNERKIPYISILTDPTTGGVSASFAMVGDVNIAEPHALVGFAGRRVIEQTIKQKLPSDFQTAEYLLHHGFMDMIVERTEMRRTLHTILSCYNRS